MFIHVCPLLKFVPLLWQTKMSFDHSLNYTEYILTKKCLPDMNDKYRYHIHTGLDLGIHLFKLKIHG